MWPPSTSTRVLLERAKNDFQVCALSINQRSKNGQRALVCTIHTRLVYCSQKAKGVQSTIFTKVVWTIDERSVWSPWTSTCLVMVDLGFCLQKGPKGLDPLGKVFVFMFWAYFSRNFYRGIKMVLLMEQRIVLIPLPSTLSSQKVQKLLRRIWSFGVRCKWDASCLPNILAFKS
jgi:hypothetical protein